MSGSESSILRGARDALAFAKGDRSKGRATAVKVPPSVDLKKIRAKLGLSQTQFASRFGFSVSTIRDWEQKRRTPDSPARILLTVIEKHPEIVEQVLVQP